MEIYLYLAEPLVTYAVKNFISLNVAEQLKHYPGPIRIIRRSMDEMITLEVDSIQSNRGNHLLVEILQYRYPHICQKEALETLWNFLSYEENRQTQMLSELKINNDDLLTLLPGDKSYPSSLGNDNDTKISNEDKKALLLLLVCIYNFFQHWGD